MKKYKIILFILLLIGCGKSDYEKNIISEYKKMISEYFYYYGLNLDDPTINKKLNRFISNNYSFLNITEDNIIEINKEDSLVYIISKRNRKKVSLKIIENVNDYCKKNSLYDRGYYSFNYKELKNVNQYKLHQYLKKSFNDTIGIPIFNKENYDGIIIYKFEDNNLSILCSDNFNEEKKIENIKDSILTFLRKEEKREFNYALIPIEIKK